MQRVELVGVCPIACSPHVERRWKNAVGSHQSEHLNTERPERCEVRHSEQPQKYPRAQLVRVRRSASAPKQSCDRREEGPMSGDEAVCGFAEKRESWNVLVCADRQC